MPGKKKTVVLGASANPSRYSYLAINRLRAHEHPVVAVGKKEGKVADVQIFKDHSIFHSQKSPGEIFPLQAALQNSFSTPLNNASPFLPC